MDEQDTDLNALIEFMEQYLEDSATPCPIEAFEQLKQLLSEKLKEPEERQHIEEVIKAKDLKISELEVCVRNLQASQSGMHDGSELDEISSLRSQNHFLPVKRSLTGAGATKNGSKRPSLLNSETIAPEFDPNQSSGQALATEKLMQELEELRHENYRSIEEMSQKLLSKEAEFEQYRLENEEKVTEYSNEMESEKKRYEAL